MALTSPVIKKKRKEKKRKKWSHPTARCEIFRRLPNLEKSVLQTGHKVTFPNNVPPTGLGYPGPKFLG